MLGKAIKIAVEAHYRQEDRGGNPYILHPLWVMNKVKHLGEDYMIVAVLHDVIEDTDWTIEKLRREGFKENILHSLELLDFKNKNYERQLKKVVLDDKARQVKLADLEHNSDITRLKGVSFSDFERMEKYHKAYTYLKY